MAAKWNSSRTMLSTTGTVSVSFPLRVMSSVYAPNREAVAAPRRQRYQGIAVMTSIVAVPTTVDTTAILPEPSQVFFGSANFSAARCFPNFFPMSAAAPSPLPHIKIAVTAMYGRLKSPQQTATKAASVRNKSSRLFLTSPCLF